MFDSFATPWTIAHQALSMVFPRQEYWKGLSFTSPGESSCPRDQAWVSCIGRQVLYHWATREALKPTVTGSLKSPPHHPLLIYCVWQLPLFNALLTTFSKTHFFASNFVFLPLHASESSSCYSSWLIPLSQATFEVLWGQDLTLIRTCIPMLLCTLLHGWLVLS